MAKSKNAPALFEVMKKGKFQAPPPPQSQEQAEPDAPEPAGPVPAPEPASPVPARQAAPEPAAAGPVEGGRAEVLRIDGGLIRTALTSTQAAIAAFVLVAVLVIAFVVGQRLGFSDGREAGYEAARKALSDDAPDELELARQQAPTDEVIFDGLGSSPITVRGDEESGDPSTASEGASTPRTHATGPWQKGLTYICVQEFQRDAREDALRAQEYLSQHAVETVLVQGPSGAKNYRLITARGFDRDRPERRRTADQYLSRVRDIGRMYFEGGGRYELQGYFVKLTRESW